MVATWRQRLRELLAHPKAGWGIAALTLLLLTPALANGLVLDDLFHREAALHARGYLGEPRHPLDLFNFMPDDEFRVRSMQLGLLPWWCSEVRLSFFRPLTALTHWLDYRLWPDLVALAHLHSLLWYGAVMLAAATLYRCTLRSAWLAGLATLLFAVDGGHTVPASWLASRNMLVACLFGVLSIHWHHRAQSESYKPGRWLSPLALLLALLGAEFGLGALGYVLAYALVLTPGRWWRRARTVAPHLAVVVAWQLTYSSLGYGVSHAGLYTHPLHEPLAFAMGAVERLPVLLASQLTLPFADYWIFAPVTWGLWLGLAAAVLVAGMGWLLWPQLRSEPTQRWFALGALLAAVPACTTFPHGRMLMFVGIGGSALIARLLERVFVEASAGRGTRWLAGALFVRHALLAALALPFLSKAPTTFRSVVAAGEKSLPGDEAVTHQTLVVVTSPHLFLSNFALAIRKLDPKGRAVPARMRTIAGTAGGARVTRVDAHTLQLHLDGGFLRGRLYGIEWDPQDARPAGYHVDLGDTAFDVVEATEDGRPLTIRARFEAPLEDPRYRWVAWQGASFAAFEPPAIGETVVLEPLDVLRLVRELE